MNKKDHLRPLLIALKAEEEAHNFYQRMGKRSTNPTGQAMFRFLAGQEKKHQQLIEQRLKKLKASLDTSRVGEKASVLSEVDFVDPALSDLELLGLALMDERHAFAFYVKVGRDVISPEEKELYTILASEEKGHIQILEKEIHRLKRK